MWTESAGELEPLHEFLRNLLGIAVDVVHLVSLSAVSPRLPSRGEMEVLLAKKIVEQGTIGDIQKRDYWLVNIAILEVFFSFPIGGTGIKDWGQGIQKKR